MLGERNNMIQYTISTPLPHRHFIQFEAIFPTHGHPTMNLQLPAWRPGRYELGNFSKNIRAWQSFDNVKHPLPFKKLNKDLWQVSCDGLEYVVVKYQYYAAELNAGSSYLDDEQLYINPVNCFFYDESDPNQYFQLTFQLPDEYEIACGLHKEKPHVLLANNFDELADSPLIASNTMKHLLYEVEGVNFYIHIQGEVNLEEARLIADFRNFTLEQLKLFGDIPSKEYHFLFHFTPFFVRHGVEHCNSTVIAMGPAADFQNEDKYHDLLGISCHELFHTWNIKSIRPAELMPYDFTKENYTRLGYVAEGVTTYYGDYLLWRTGAFPDAEWLEIIADDIQTYMDNPGRFNHSVADSSYDTWLDGYGAGIPWRKVSIYNEGFLIALICDLQIRWHSAGKASLDDVMREMYVRYGKQKMGYTDDNYMQLVNEISGSYLSHIFTSIVYGKDDYMPLLTQSLSLVGLEIIEIASPKWSEAYLGLVADEQPAKANVQSVMPDSPADKAGLWNGDEILTINGTAPYKNFQHLLKMSGDQLQFTFLRKGKIKSCEANVDDRIWGKRFKVIESPNAIEEQLVRRAEWNRSF
ncbi:MAG: M61 family metallopeptidase [Flavobacteriales bacterium]